MNREYLKEKLDELTALLDCYKQLEKWSLQSEDALQKNAGNVGMAVLREKIREILSEEQIFQIIAAGEPYPMEDFIWFIKSDTQHYIDKIHKLIFPDQK